MKMLRILMPAIVAGIFIGCKGKQADFKQTVVDFAAMECEAVKLREQRFAMANEIRFTEDTLLHTANKTDTVRLRSKLNELTARKQGLLNVSRQMADKIKARMDSLNAELLNSKEAKARFNSELNEELKTRNCLE